MRQEDPLSWELQPPALSVTFSKNIQERANLLQCYICFETLMNDQVDQSDHHHDIFFHENDWKVRKRESLKPTPLINDTLKRAYSQSGKNRKSVFFCSSW